MEFEQYVWDSPCFKTNFLVYLNFGDVCPYYQRKNCGLRVPILTGPAAWRISLDAFNFHNLN